MHKDVFDGYEEAEFLGFFALKRYYCKSFVSVLLTINKSNRDWGAIYVISGVINVL